ncbi:MAG: M14 family zinc carboxypeptidase, partial [Gemmatimonadota bacterium]
MQMLVVPILVILPVVGPLPAQEPEGEGQLRLPPDLPEVHLGFRPGEDYQVVDWGQATGYLEALARQSDRVRLDTIGRSTLDRPMVLVTITDPANQASLAQIRAVQARLADPRSIADPAERAELIRNGRVVVLITSGIHPTEVGGSLAALELAYRLASATDPTTLKVLRECVVLIVPSLNPDGVDMVAEWYRASVGMPWEGSPPPFLYHHYTGHDNNRDWYAFTQLETRSVVERVYNEWHPQIVHDIHQQGLR